jgi:DNA replication and repair protein RecF
VSITRLTLTEFRSYAMVLIAPQPGFVILTGENGAGKTNILEAVSLLASGRGLRGGTLAEMARKGGPGHFAIAADVNGVRLGTGTDAAAPSRRVARVNGAAAPIAALGDWLSIIWLTPAQDRLFVEGASERRRFLDRFILALEPGHAHDVTRYEAAMRQRNRLLAERRGDASWLAALERAMADHGTAITDRRAQLVAALSSRIATISDDAFARASLSLQGWDGGDLQSLLAANRARDAIAGRALEGPHRHDLVVRHAAKDQLAAQSSTGEQKALLLGLVLAHAALVTEARGAAPILLLDEVAAHLDPVRRSALFARLDTMGSQVWLTGTEAAPFSSLSGTHYHVENGTINLT